MTGRNTNRLPEDVSDRRLALQQGGGRERPLSSGYGWQVPITQRWLVGQSQFVVQTLVVGGRQ